MAKLIIIIDLHCDASMPSGAEEFGGGNMYSRNLLKCLQQLNIQFIYITRKKFPFLESKINLENNSLFFRIDLGDFSYNDKDILQEYQETAYEKIKEIIETYALGFQLVFHSFYWQSGLIANRLSSLYQTYFVHSVLSNAERKKLQGAVSDIAPERLDSEHAIFNAAKYIICSSKSEYRDMLELYNQPEEKIFVTGRWIAQSYLAPAYYPNGHVRMHPLSAHFPVHYIECSEDKCVCRNNAYWNTKGFIYFGRIHPNKGLPQIIAAWLELYQTYKSQMPALWIVGGTPQQILRFREKYMKPYTLLDFAEAEGKLIWWGTLPSEGISTLLLKCHAVIMHSKYEAGGIIVMEAMSQGIPVIATPFGFAKDFIEEGINGYLVPFDDTSALTEKMQYFIKQPYLGNYLGRNARQKSQEVLVNWDFLQLHLKLYEIESPTNLILKQKISDSKVYKNSVDIYPYCFELPDPAYIKHIASQKLGKMILKVTKTENDREYVEWVIETTNGFSYFYYFYPMLNVESMYDGRKPYVFDSCYRIRGMLSSLSRNDIRYADETNGHLLLDEKLEVLYESTN